MNIAHYLLTEHHTPEQQVAFDAWLNTPTEEPRPVPGAPVEAPIPEAPAWLVSDEEAAEQAEAVAAWLESQG